MSETLTEKTAQNDDMNTEKSKTQPHCPECKEPIPRGSYFCPQCDPPGESTDDPEKGLSFGQAFLRISLIVALFVVIAIFKLDITLDNVMEVMDPDHKGAGQMTGGTPAKDSDFQVIHFVNANRANIRSKPSTQGEVLGQADKGEKVTILERKEKWSKVEAGGTKGWISNTLLSSEVQ